MTEESGWGRLPWQCVAANAEHAGQWGTTLKVRRREISASYVVNDAEWRSGLDLRPAAPRERISSFTSSTAGRLRRFVDNFRQDFRVFVTLTYPSEFPTDGREVKRHLAAFFERWRRRGLFERDSCVWFLEFQKRGAPHFHILSTGWMAKQTVAKDWSEITAGDESACSRVEGIREPARAGAYARKYAVKADQKEVPAAYSGVGRFWGCRGKKTVEGVPRVPCVAATIRQTSPDALRLIVEKVKGVRVYETLTGWVCFGAEEAIWRAWRHVQQKLCIATSGPGERSSGDGRPRTLAASFARHSTQG